MRIALATCLLLAFSSPSLAQDVKPFDMTPETGVETPAAPTPSNTPEPTPLPVPVPVAPSPISPPAASAVPEPPPSTAPPGPAARRNLLPFAELSLSGEIDRRAWSIYLTAEQAASRATLHFAYQNAIVVAPETSTIEITINGETLLKEAVRSSETVTELNVQIPPGVLKPGPNSFSVASAMRHRTDCTVQSTYELWASVDPARTYLEFSTLEAGLFRRTSDIAAIGVDDAGATRFDVVVPALDRLAPTSSVMRLAEGLAMTANMPNQSFKVSRELPVQPGPGKITVIVGTARELAGIVPNLPREASTSPIATFVDYEGASGSMLVISGPDWRAVDGAIDTIVTPLQRPLASRRTAVSTEAWRSPDAPLFYDAGRQSFAALGVPTQEFTGRRFRTDFGFSVPSDFYSNDYGHAQILLDAAYSAAVKPGSHIDVYVNSNIAATVPITQKGGGILRHFAVDVTMRHFRPGPNVVTIEAVLSTDEDDVCTPGAISSDAARFALFDTSEFVVPAFARVARKPDLGAMAGTGYPYARSETPLALFVDNSSPEALSAAATVLGKISVAAGRPIAVDTNVARSGADRNAIFIDTTAAVQPSVLSQVGLSGDIGTSWKTDGGAEASGTGASTDAAFEKWREELSGSGWRGAVSQLEDWASRTFDVQLGVEQLVGGEGSFVPGNSARLVIAQQQTPSASAMWTVISAPTLAVLDEAVTALVRQDNWSRLSGQISTLDATMQNVATIAPASVAFAVTQPLSIGNARLIVANWLSANPMSYAAVLFLLCLLLGLVTALLLSSLGRRR